jgi:hypothetical protein
VVTGARFWGAPAILESLSGCFSTAFCGHEYQLLLWGRHASLLRLLFVVQRRVVLSLRGGMQALLSRCTILPVISCSNVTLSKCLQMVGQHRPTKVHTCKDAVSVFVMSKNPWHSNLCPQRRRLVHHLYSDTFLCHHVGCIIHRAHVI